MNTKLYKQVFALAGELLEAVEKEDDQAFERLYDNLQNLCEQHEQDDKNHPVQWETLADFTEDGELALSLYRKALDYALKLEADDYIASISYAMALLIRDDTDLQLQVEEGVCIALARQAEVYGERTQDSELQREINKLLSSLQ